MDPIADLADRLRAKQRRGEDPEFEFAIEWGALTEDERDEFRALVDQRKAHGEEMVERTEDNNRTLTALAMLVVRSDAPPGTTLGEALNAGYIGVMDVIETIRPGPLAQTG